MHHAHSPSRILHHPSHSSFFIILLILEGQSGTSRLRYRLRVFQLLSGETSTLTAASYKNNVALHAG